MTDVVRRTNGKSGKKLNQDLHWCNCEFTVKEK